MTAAIKLRHKALTKAEQKAKQEARRDKPNTMLLPGLVAEQQRMLASRDTTRVAGMRLTNGSSYGPYTGEALTPARPGSSDALTVPSLENGERRAYKPPAAICVGYSKVFTAGYIK